MILKQQTVSCQRYLPTLPNLLESSCHHILILSTFDQSGSYFNKYPLKFVSCVIYRGMVLYIELGLSLFALKTVLEGIGGEYNQTAALANVRLLQRLNPQIQIIGTGGVLTGRDAFEHILWCEVWCK